MRTKTIFIAIVLASFSLSSVPSSAQMRSYDIMVDEGGKPLKRNKKSEEPRRTPKKQPKIPRGSSYIPNMTLPRTEPVLPPSATSVYKPPPINSFSDRVTGCNHSFPLNAGIGNNPTDRSAYIRQCAN
jgi:hypothetical protein